MKNEGSKELSEMSLEELWQLFPIILKEHSSDYKKWYEEEKENLNRVIGDYIKRINHIGSTAVKGLLAKPTVDILVEVGEDAEIAELKSILIANGWILMHENDEDELNLVFNKGYTPQGFAERVFHLHLRYLKDWDELYFRDYLISHPDIAAEYGSLKKSLEKEYKNNRDGYTEAKSDFIKKYTAAARKELKGKYQLDN